MLNQRRFNWSARAEGKTGPKRNYDGQRDLEDRKKLIRKEFTEAHRLELPNDLLSGQCPAVSCCLSLSLFLFPLASDFYHQTSIDLPRILSSFNSREKLPLRFEIFHPFVFYSPLFAPFDSTCQILDTRISRGRSKVIRVNKNLLIPRIKQFEASNINGPQCFSFSSLDLSFSEVITE